jgi:hypothetical protein
VFGAEEELVVEVGPLDHVHVRHVDAALRRGSDAHGGPDLEHLASDRPRAGEEVLLLPQQALHLSPEDRHLPVIPRPFLFGMTQSSSA